MARRKKQLSTYITADQYDELQALSKRTRTPMAVFVRDALDYILKINSDSRFESAAMPGGGN